MIICFLSWTRKNKNTYDPVPRCKDQRTFPNLKKKNLIPHPVAPPHLPRTSQFHLKSRSVPALVLSKANAYQCFQAVITLHSSYHYRNATEHHKKVHHFLKKFHVIRQTKCKNEYIDKQTKNKNQLFCTLFSYWQFAQRPKISPIWQPDE